MKRNPKTRRKSNDFAIFKTRPAAILILLFTLLATTLSCSSAENRPLEERYVSVPDAGVTIENVVLNPDAYIGRQVTIAGTIKETYGEKAFLLHGEKLVNELLAVGADPFPEKPNDAFDYSLAPVKAVRVTGVVRRFDAAAFERETGVSANETGGERFAGKPVIVVESIEKAET
jgi:hypothetical protein